MPSVFEPTIVDKATAKAAFPHYERLFFLILGIDEFLMLRRTPAGWTAPPDVSAENSGSKRAL